jgi:hypothetical protein
MNRELIVGKEQQFTTINEAIDYINNTNDDNNNNNNNNNNNDNNNNNNNNNDNNDNNDNIDLIKTINYITSIKVLDGIYEEIIILPNNTQLIGNNVDNVILQFPTINLPGMINSTLISCNDNNIIQNISINLDSNYNKKSLFNDNDEIIGIYCQNKNNIKLKNIVFKNENLLLKNKIIGIFIHGGERHFIDNIIINFNLGFGEIYGIYLEYIQQLSLSNSKINISSPSKQNIGIYIENNINYNNINLLSNKIDISYSENNYGIYLVNSSLILDYSSINIKGFNNINNNAIYCSNDNISNNILDDDTFIKIMPPNIEIKDNIVKFIKCNVNDDDENENEKLLGLDLDLNLELTFIDLGYKKNDIICIENIHYNIIDINEEYLKIDIINKNMDLNSKSSNTLNKIHQLHLNYNTLSTIEVNKVVNNDTIFINNSDKYLVYNNYSTLIGSNINISNSIYKKLNINNNNILVSNDINSDIKSISSALQLIKNINNKNDNMYDKYHFIKIDKGYFKEKDGLLLENNCLLDGIGIDKTIVEVTINKEINIKLCANTLISNLTLIIIIDNDDNDDNKIPELNCILGDINCQFKNVKIEFKILIQNDTIQTINGFNFKDINYKFNNCEFNIEHDIKLFNLFHIEKCSSIFEKCKFKLSNCNILNIINGNLELNECDLHINNVIFLTINNNDTINYKIILDKCKIVTLENNEVNNSIFDNKLVNPIINPIIKQENDESLFIKNCLFDNINFDFNNKYNICFDSCFYYDSIRYIYELLNKWGELETKNTIIGDYNKINQTDIENNILIGEFNNINIKNNNNLIIGYQHKLKNDMSINDDDNNGDNDNDNDNEDDDDDDKIINTTGNILIGNNILSNINSKNTFNNTIIGFNDNNFNKEKCKSNSKNNNVIIGNNALYNQYGNYNVIITPNGSENNKPHKEDNIFTVFGGSSLSEKTPLLYGCMKKNIIGINTSKIINDNECDGDHCDDDGDGNIGDDNIKLVINGNIKCNGILDNINYENVLIDESNLDNIQLHKGILITRINLSKCSLSEKENDKAIVGIYKKKNIIKIKDDYNVNHSIIVSGKCGVWCCDINGEIEIGDYITSSKLPGIGMKQIDDIKHNYTIGKCIQKVKWNEITNIIEMDGDIIKKVYLIILMK